MKEKSEKLKVGLVSAYMLRQYFVVHNSLD
jgi:hypothetical protein